MEENLIYAGFIALTAGSAICLYLFFLRFALHKSKSSRRWKLLVGNLLVLLFLASLMGLVGEIYFRFFRDTTDSFALTKTSKRWFDRHYHVNRMGFRDDCEYSEKRPEGKRRITLVGDSFTAGHGIRNVADRFANRLRATHTDWEIQVLAEPGKDTGMELELLRKLGSEDYEFDTVVLVYCLNDIGDATRELIEPNEKLTERFKQNPPGFLVRNSYLFNTLYYRLQMRTVPELSGYFSYQHDAYSGRAWEIQKLRLTAMRDIVHGRGGEFCVVTFPYLHLIGGNYEFRDVHRNLDDFWHGIEVRHLDLLPVLESHTPQKLMVNSFDAHPNEFAHSVVSTALSAFLKKQPWLTAQSKPRPVSAPDNKASQTVISCYSKMLEMDPGNVQTHHSLGNLLVGAGRSEEALVHFKKAVELRPDVAEYRNNLGVLLLADGQVSEAVGHFRKALESDPLYAETHYNLGMALAKGGQVGDAIAEYRKALELQPEHPKAHYDLALALSATGQTGEAIAHYQKALEVKPDSIEAMNNLSAIFFREGRLDESIHWLQKALETKPDYQSARRNLALVEAERDKMIKTLAVRREEIRTKPEDASLLNDTAWMLATNPNASVRNGTEAVELARRAVQLTDSKEPMMLGTLAAAYAEASRFPEAVETARHAQRIASEQKLPALADLLQSRIRLFEAKSPFHEAPKPSE